MELMSDNLRTLLVSTTMHGRVLVRDAPQPTGVLVGFHGYTESAAIQMERLVALELREWTLVSVQALNRFYRGRSSDVVAGWMTRQDRDAAIEDNIAYVDRVLDAVASKDLPVMCTGFSQGVAMAFRAGLRGARKATAVVGVGGDIPPELLEDASLRFPAVLLVRGASDEWYTAAKLESNVAALRQRGGAAETLVHAGGHEWTPEAAAKIAEFLRSHCDIVRTGFGLEVRIEDMSVTAIRSRNRQEIPERYKWNLQDIFPDWDAWQRGYETLDAGIEKYASLKGTLAQGPERLLEAFQLSDEFGQLAYRVWYYPSLRYDEDQRDNAVNAKRQQVQILFARLQEAQSWFNPELLKIPLATVREWMDSHEPLRLYRFAIEDLYRQQEHVLDEAGERLMSLSTRLASAPNDAYWSLSTADAKFPTITLSSGEEVTVSYGQYRAILATRREQSDREKAFRALYGTYNASINTYATLYNGVCHRDWFQARARGYASSLEAALHGNNIPTSVVENLISTTRAGVEPLRRYHRLRKRTLGLDRYQVYDFAIPLVTFDRQYSTTRVSTGS